MKHIQNIRKKVFFISLTLLLSIMTYLYYFPYVKATRTYPYGVCGTPAYVDTWGPNNDYTTQVDFHCYGINLWDYKGLYTVTPYAYEIYLPGPILTSFMGYYGDYILQNNLVIEQVIAWRPVFYFESKSWYSHELKVESSTSDTFSSEFKVGIGSAYGGCSIFGGATQSISTTITGGWTESVSNGDWKIVYLRMVFLRVYGTVHYFNDEVRTYDAIIVEDVDFNNRFVTSSIWGDSKELPEFTIDKYWDSDGDGQRDEFRYLGNTYFTYSQVKSITNYFGVDLTVSNQYFKMNGYAKFIWSTGSSVTFKHTFQGTLPSDKYFYVKMNNYFNINLEIHSTSGGGGGGCPILSVYDGEEYIDEGLLDIHDPNGIDQITSHVLRITPECVNQRYLVRLTEHPKTISYIDNVQLKGKLANGIIIPLTFLNAQHSSLGDVTNTLRLSDDVRVEERGADHNNGVSEYIYLEFLGPSCLNFEEYIFVIEGNNYFVK